MGRLVGIGVTWKLAGQVGTQLIRLVIVAVLARLLTPNDYGAAAIAIALAQFAGEPAGHRNRETSPRSLLDIRRPVTQP